MKKNKMILLATLLSITLVGAIGYTSSNKLEENAQEAEEKGKAVAMFVQDTKETIKRANRKNFQKKDIY